MKQRYKSKRRNNVKRKNKYKPSKGHKFSLLKWLVGIIAVAAILYKISPDVIELKVNLSSAEKDEIKQVVYEVLSEQKAQEEQKAIVEDATDSKKEDTKSEEVKVTSRGGGESIRHNNTTIKTTGYRITSYHPGDGYGSGNKTGSGKSTSSFDTMKIGNKNVYTYQGKIVVAAATKELLNTGYSVKGAQTSQPDKHYFKYYDTLKIKFNGNTYDAIVLDSCGASMWTGEYRIDIYVPTAQDVINSNNVELIF